VTDLVRERRQIEQILDQVNEGILLIDREGIVKFANRRAFLWLGFQRFFKDRSLIVDLVEEPLVKRFVLECLKRPEEAVSDQFEVLTPREMSLHLHWIPLSSEESTEILIRIENVTREVARGEEEAQAQAREEDAAPGKISAGDWVPRAA
jgi:PAS domain-containing protein